MPAGEAPPTGEAPPADSAPVCATRKQTKKKARHSRRGARGSPPPTSSSSSPASPSTPFEPAFAVVYHRGCNDGRAGALAAWLQLPEPERGRLSRILWERAADGLPEAHARRGGTAAELGRCAKADREGLPLFLTASPNESPPSILWAKARTVYLVDICYSPEGLRALCRGVREAGGRVVLLDHHESARRAVAELKGDAGAPGLEAHFDDRVDADGERVPEAGAQVAWRYFAGAARRGELGPPSEPAPEPRVVSYVGDRDIWWKMGLPRSEEVNEALMADGWFLTFGRAAELVAREGEVGPEALVQELADRGAVFLQAKRTQVARLTNCSWPAFLEVRRDDRTRVAYRIRAVNASAYQSDIGNAICVAAREGRFAGEREGRRGGTPGSGGEASSGGQIHFAAVWHYSLGDDRTSVALRTDRPDLDLSWIAPRVVGATRGGGHPSAAGFSFRGSDVSSVFLRRPDPEVACAPFARGDC